MKTISFEEYRTRVRPGDYIHVKSYEHAHTKGDWGITLRNGCVSYFRGGWDTNFGLDIGYGRVDMVLFQDDVGEGEFASILRNPNSMDTDHICLVMKKE